MTRRRILGSILVVLAMFWVHSRTTNAQSSSSPALTGQVTSQEEGAMEGVLVSAKRAGSTMTITVVTDAQGRYSFPQSRLEPGPYSIRIRAVGYDLETPGNAEVKAQASAALDLKLRKTKNLLRQLSNGEWLMSMPGTDEQKQSFIGCTTCHTLERIARSQHDAAEWVQVWLRMSNYSQGSTPTRPQLRPSAGRGAGGGDMEAAPANLLKSAAYAATINLASSSTFPYELKTLPRPRGKATKVIITEYDLPRPEALPHDAMADSQGMVWYSDFGSQYLGKLDPKTGKIVEYPVPLVDPKAPKGALDLGLDPEGKIWQGTMYQGVIARFDPKTEKFETWKSPKFGQGDAARTAMVTPTRLNVDGKVWVGADEEYQVDLKTGQWVAIDYKRDIPKDSPLFNRNFGSYGVAVDSKNNFYGMNLGGEFVTRVDAKTMKATPFVTPTRNSGPRRGHMDDQDRLWFAEFRGNNIGMFDTRTEKFTEYKVPTPWTNPYDAILDHSGYAWSGGMSNDHIVRVNTKTGEVTEYLLPRMTNVRRVNVDNSTTPPTFWVGNNLGAAVIKVEPLEP
jgi:virginiamycin B lyase